MPTKHPSAIWDKLIAETLDVMASASGEHGLITAQDISLPPDPSLGDLAVPTFKLAPKFKLAPALIATNLANLITEQHQALKRPALVESVSAAGPYLNFRYRLPAVAKAVITDVAKTKTKYGQVGANKQRVMIEHSSPNTLKQYHIGHLRNTLLGDALVRLYRSQGFTVIAASYPGDMGAHIAKCIWALKTFHPSEPLPKKNIGKYFGAAYTEAVRELERKPERKAEVDAIQQQLEAGDKTLKALWRKTRALSLKEFAQIFNELGVKIDAFFYESEVEAPGKSMVLELLEQGKLKRSQGAVIADLEAEKLGVLLLLKSDGTSLYATKDLPLALEKIKKYKLDRSIYVVDVRQSLYFKQVFAVLRRLGVTAELQHVDYEVLNLPEGAMSSRRGNIVEYDDFRAELIARAAEGVVERHADWSSKAQREAATAIATAAMKFTVLATDPGKIITFDLKSALSFDGFTGPYLLYTYARVGSIIAKAKRADRIAKPADWETLREPTERAIAWALAMYPRTLARAQTNNDPAELTRYLWELAKAVNTFYHAEPVLAAEDVATRRARLALITAARQTLANGLNLLGIKPIEKM